MQREKMRLEGFEKMVDSLSPERILKMGFAVVRRAGSALKSAESLRAGDAVEIVLSDGALEAEVKKIIDRE